MMNEVQKQNIKNVISILGEKGGYSSLDIEKVIHYYFLKYSDYNLAISDLALDTYTLFRNRNKELMNYGFDLLRKISPVTWKSRDEQIFACEDRLRHNMLNQSGMSLEENHRAIIELFSYICNKFYELGIDYYLVGAFPCYLKTSGTLKRFHGDIDFMINEKDIDQLQKLIKNENWHFFDNRLHSKKIWNGDLQKEPVGEHEIIARCDNTTFYIGGICFRRGIEGEVINREYFLKNGEPMVMEIHNSPELTTLEYPDSYSEFNGVLFKACSLESTYVRKKINYRDKDIGDIQFLQQYINKKVVARYEELLHSQRTFQILSAYDKIDKKHCK